MTDSHDGDGSDRDPPPSGSRRDDGDRETGEPSSDDESLATDDPDRGSDAREEADTDAASDPGDGNPENGDESDGAADSESAVDSDGEVGTDGEPDGGRPPNPENAGAANDASAPMPEPSSEDAKPVPSPEEDPIGWFRRTDNEAVIVFKDVASSVGIVVVIGLVLFGVSGVWPPLVAIESGSMNPHMQKGDLVFIMEEDRLEPAAAVDGTGVVTYQQGKETGYKTFGSYGDVIVFRPNGENTTPIIHRARFYVEEGERWYDKADKDHLQADSCAELRQCPANYSGFVTKGDNPRTNQHYDQSNRYKIVKPEWIQGTAEVRLPWLGCIRLEFSGTASCRPLFGTSQPATPGSLAAGPPLSSRTHVAAPRS